MKFQNAANETFRAQRSEHGMARELASILRSAQREAKCAFEISIQIRS